MTPDIGVIEGFFGRPWDDAARQNYAPFLRSHGFSYYIYAPKADRSLRRQWQVPLANEQQARLAGLSANFRACALQFGIGLTPYDLHHDYSTQARAALRCKVEQLNQVGVDILAVLFDDMHSAVPGLAQLQARIVTDISQWTAARRIFFCPTYYSDDPILQIAFGVAPQNYLQDLGAALDPAVDVFWTGQQVCSTGYPDEHLEDVASRLGRKPLIWDNHIANDGRARCSHLYLDALSDGWSLSPGRVAGLAVNPMNQPALSRIPLAAIAARFLGAGSEGARSSVAMPAKSICSEALGGELVAALDLLQIQGLSSLEVSARSRLIAQFQRHAPEPCALEVCSWLRGEYAFDPQCLTD